MTTHPLYLPASLIPAFVAGRVTMLIEPFKLPDYRLTEAQVLENLVILGNPHFGLVRYVPLPHAPGDRLWLREAYWTCEECGYVNPCLNANSAGVGNAKCCASCDEILPERIHPPITMPKWASRAWAEAVSVEVKRVQDVTTREMLACGIEYDETCLIRDGHMMASYNAFRRHFTATHGPDAWERNPWCTFATIKPHARAMLKAREVSDA